ncbi:hypothetical protein [Actinomycetospora flava]|uniref:Anti-sigma regulatory factor (Ser/Thr protein kinase) n=1 Tax=Actinomycetospora flava TaxID=3129232 RepID=A0ABU8MCI1_9PSEU
MSHTATVGLPITSSTVRDARTITLALATAWGAPVSLEDLVLLVDDLTADVVTHAGDEASLALELSLTGGVLRVALVDGEAVRPVDDDAVPFARHWALATAWGDEPDGDGHRVWFEIGPPPGLETPHPDVSSDTIWHALERALGSPRSADGDPSAS